MAIHVKPVFSARQQLLRNLRRMLVLALCVTLFALISGTFTMYLQYFLIEKDSGTTFIYVEPVKETPFAHQPKPTTPALSGGSTEAARSAAVTPDIIVSTTADDSFSMSTISFDMADGLDSEATGLFDFGLGLSGDGSEAGEGTGTGSGKGSGSGQGGGGSGKGYNDDIQVVLALDASGSMDELFVAVANAINDVLTTLGNAKLNGKKTKVNVGIVVYGQGKDDGKPFILSRFTTNVKKLAAEISQTSCDGSEEHCGAAIQLAVQRFPWNMRERDDMLKVIFICGNEPFNMGKVDYRTAIEQAKAGNIIVNTVHCGDYEDAEWQQAALLGNGQGLTYNFTTKAMTQKEADKQRRSALTELSRIPLLPIGSPAEQKERLELYKQPSPPPANTKALAKWISTNRELIIDGVEWDAAELCRRTGIDTFTLDHIGGRGNLPLSLRGQSDIEALQSIRTAAKARDYQLSRYRECTNEFAEQILETLQEQANSKGIIIEL